MPSSSWSFASASNGTRIGSTIVATSSNTPSGTIRYLNSSSFGNRSSDLLVDLVAARHRERQLEVLDDDAGKVPLGDVPVRDEDLDEHVAVPVLRVERIRDRVGLDASALRQDLR